MLALKLLSLCVQLSLFTVIFADSGVDLLPSRDVCGKQQQERIVGGQEVNIGEFPWMAVLYFKEGDTIEFMCGGTLINNRYILTAAHCVEDPLFSVRLGEHNRATDEDCDDGEPGLQYCSDPPTDIEIEEKIVHEKFNILLQRHDIALLRLKQQVNYTDFIKPICLPISPELINNTFDGETALVAGWGNTGNASESETLLKVEAPIISHKSCAKKYLRSYIFVTNKQICAGGEEGESSCYGDSGGPLMYLHKTPEEENWVEIGVVSFGKACAQKNLPVVYTRVSEYMPWILEHLKP